jgi:hypothetical protein
LVCSIGHLREAVCHYVGGVGVVLRGIDEGWRERAGFMPELVKQDIASTAAMLVNKAQCFMPEPRADTHLFLELMDWLRS